MMAKLCYIVPEYNPKSPTHFAYLVDFVEELKKIYDLRLIEEKRWRLFLPCRLLWARISGYKDFYVHYSFLSALASSLIVKIFGGRVFYWNCGLPWKYRRNFLRESFERLTYKMITYLVTGTENIKKQYTAYYNLPSEKIKVMPNWINLEKIKNQKSKIKINELRKNLNINGGQKILLFVHRLSKRKGAHYLSEILNKLADAKLRTNANDAKDFVLIIIGDGPEQESLKFKVTSLKLQEKVRFLGSISNDQLSNYYLLADVLIMPSEEEGFPHVLLEAMAAGLPFVTFDVGGIKEIVSLDLLEYVVSVGDLENFIAKVKKILYDPILAKHISESEMRRVAEFDIKKVVRIFEGLFNHG